MPPEQTDSTSPSCPRCDEALAPKTVRTTIWREDRVTIVEDIPAHVCGSCMEQFYDDDVSDALRVLVAEGFPAEAADKEIQVPVFSLKGRIRTRKALPEDSYVD